MQDSESSATHKYRSGDLPHCMAFDRYRQIESIFGGKFHQV
jgi:hypothetical protein